MASRQSQEQLRCGVAERPSTAGEGPSSLWTSIGGGGGGSGRPDSAAGGARHSKGGGAEATGQAWHGLRPDSGYGSAHGGRPDSAAGSLRPQSGARQAALPLEGAPPARHGRPDSAVGSMRQPAAEAQQRPPSARPMTARPGSARGGSVPQAFPQSLSFKEGRDGFFDIQDVPDDDHIEGEEAALQESRKGAAQPHMRLVTTNYGMTLDQYMSRMVTTPASAAATSGLGIGASAAEANTRKGHALPLHGVSHSPGFEAQALRRRPESAAVPSGADPPVGGSARSSMPVGRPGSLSRKAAAAMGGVPETGAWYGPDASSMNFVGKQRIGKH